MGQKPACLGERLMGRETKNMTREAEGARQGDTAEGEGGREESLWGLRRLGTLGTSLRWGG